MNDIIARIPFKTHKKGEKNINEIENVCECVRYIPNRPTE